MFIQVPFNKFHACADCFLLAAQSNWRMSEV